jgi:hypothetical protein
MGSQERGAYCQPGSGRVRAPARPGPKICHQIALIAHNQGQTGRPTSRWPKFRRWIQVAQEREPYLKSFLDKFADTFFDGIERQFRVDTFRGHRHLGSLANIGGHDVHYTDARAGPAVCLNGNLTLVTHDAPDQFAGGARVQTGFVRNQNSPCDRFMRLLLHGQPVLSYRKN